MTGEEFERQKTEHVVLVSVKCVHGKKKYGGRALLKRTSLVIRAFFSNPRDKIELRWIVREDLFERSTFWRVRIKISNLRSPLFFQIDEIPRTDQRTD